MNSHQINDPETRSSTQFRVEILKRFAVPEMNRDLNFSGESLSGFHLAAPGFFTPRAGERRDRD